MEHVRFSPNFFVVGAAKAGTTAVYSWLREHPDVFLPHIKEPGFFAYANESATPRNGPYDPSYAAQITVEHETYAALYKTAGTRLTGDVSPVYLLNRKAAARISASTESARIIILLRDPVRRAFSQFLHHVRDSLESSETFEEGLAREKQRLRQGWSWGFGYATHGHYAPQIQRYLDVFPRKQILFLEYQALQTEPEACWKQITTHLGLPYREVMQKDRVNATATLLHVSRYPWVSRHLRHPGAVQSGLKRLLPASVRSGLRRALEGRKRPVPVLTDETRQSLAQRYHGERCQIEAQTGLSLAHWFA